MTHPRSYHVEPNDCPLTRKTTPWLIVCCPDDGRSLPYGSREMAERHADLLNIHDTVPVSLSTEAVRANAL